MSLLEKKMDAMARFCLAETLADRKAAMDQLRELLDEKVHAPDVQSLIYKALRDLGVPNGIKGHTHLVEAIERTVWDPKAVNCMYGDQGIYGVVAAAQDSTDKRVARAIRHAIESGLARADMEVVTQYFGGTINPDKGKPTGREYIAQVAYIVRQQLKEVA